MRQAKQRRVAGVIGEAPDFPVRVIPYRVVLLDTVGDALLGDQSGAAGVVMYQFRG
jgi:hypothetical protein